MEAHNYQINFFVFIVFASCKIMASLTKYNLDSVDSTIGIPEKNKKCSHISEHPRYQEGYQFPTFAKMSQFRGRRAILPRENHAEKYPTERDRDMVQMALDNPTFTNATFYETLQQDHLYCPLSETCYLHPRLTYNDFKLYESCCLQCSCAKDCFSSESCCADADVIEDDSDKACITTQILPYGKSQVNNKFHVVSVVKCNTQFTVEKTKQLCEGQNATLDSLDFSRPVIANGTIYRNKFCALCNFALEHDIQPFNVQIMCPNGKGIYAYSVANLLNQLVSENRCNIMYYLPFTFPAKTCFKGFIHECNVTGKWQHFDPHIEKACMSYTHVYRGIYRNVFCYMCNNNDDPFMKCSRNDIGGIGGFTMGSFTAMLHFTEDTDDGFIYRPDNLCKRDEIMDSFMVGGHYGL